MSKKNNSVIPDFSRKKPLPGAKSTAIGASKASLPNPRQPQKPPAKAKNGGRRGT